MALVYFPACGTTQGPADTTGDVALCTAQVLTSSYVATTNHVLVKGFSEVTFKITYTKGAETTTQIKVEGSSDGGTDWFPLGYKATQGSGVSELTVDVLQITGTLTVSTPPFDRRGHALVRCSIKGTGGSPDGTMTIEACGSVNTVRM